MRQFEQQIGEYTVTTYGGGTAVSIAYEGHVLCMQGDDAVLFLDRLNAIPETSKYTKADMLAEYVEAVGVPANG